MTTGADEVDSGPVIEMDQLPDDRQARLPWRRVAAVALLLVVGLGWYALGDRHGHPAGTGQTAVDLPSSAAVTRPGRLGGPDLADGATILASGDTCTALTGPVLQVGADVSNVSGSPVAVTKVNTTLPQAGGLRLLSQAWGECGEQSPPTGATQVVPPGGTLWFTATFELIQLCPTGYPVQFTVVSTRGGRQTFTPVDEFPDLSVVDFHWCR